MFTYLNIVWFFLTDLLNVVALTRTQERAQSLAAQGIESAIADVFDSQSVKAAVIRAQPEVVIEQLTALPRTYTRESMNATVALNTRIRSEEGANVLAAAKAAGARLFLKQSMAFWAIRGAGLVDEETPLSGVAELRYDQFKEKVAKTIN